MLLMSQTTLVLLLHLSSRDSRTAAGARACWYMMPRLCCSCSAGFVTLSWTPGLLVCWSAGLQPFNILLACSNQHGTVVLTHVVLRKLPPSA